MRDKAKDAGGGLPSERTVSVAEAGAFGDVIVLATPWSGTPDAVRAAGDLKGKTVIDCTNPVLPDFSALAVGLTTSAAEEIAKLIPTAHVVKCFNTLGASNFANPEFGGERASMFFCGDDASAKLVVAELGDRVHVHAASWMLGSA